MLKLKLIAAVCDDMGIGINNTLPWKLRNEMNHFETMTTMTKNDGKQNAVIMGRKTWQSIPQKYRPLKKRLNIVLSRQTGNDFPGATLTVNKLEDAILQLESPLFVNRIESVFIIGGEQIYKLAIESGRCDRIYLTRIKAHYDCDTFFPPIPMDKFRLTCDPNVPDEIQLENGIEYKYEVYSRH